MNATCSSQKGVMKSTTSVLDFVTVTSHVAKSTSCNRHEHYWLWSKLHMYRNIVKRGEMEHEITLFMQLNHSRNVLFLRHLFYDHIWSIEH